jgi:hypothetical protein
MCGCSGRNHRQTGFSAADHIHTACGDGKFSGEVTRIVKKSRYFGGKKDFARPAGLLRSWLSLSLRASIYPISDAERRFVQKCLNKALFLLVASHAQPEIR